MRTITVEAGETVESAMARQPARAKPLAVNQWQLLVETLAHVIALRTIIGEKTDLCDVDLMFASDTPIGGAWRSLARSAYPVAQEAARPIIDRTMAFAKREGE